MQDKKVSLLITDLDNTLFDWFNLWYYPFNAMLTKLSEKSGISRSTLMPEIRQIHQRHGTSEYAFLIEELPSLRRAYPEVNLVEHFSDAINSYRLERHKHMRLYPGVMRTLQAVREQGCIIVGYTESLAFYTNYRLRKLCLDGVLDYLYSPADHDLPAGLTQEQIRLYPAESYRLRKTVHRHTPPGELKPNPDVLLDIIQQLDRNPSDSVYVGDSLFKDVAMAQDAGVTDVYAEYGAGHRSEGSDDQYELLRQVTHWTAEDVEREKNLKEKHVKPTHVLEGGLAELLALFRFGTNQKSGSRAGLPSHVLEAWKKSVDVQQHFNDIGIKLRNLAITVFGAFLGGIAFSLKEHLMIDIYGANVPLASMLAFSALVVWLAFFFMDRFWYHKLLLGAVYHAKDIESKYSDAFQELGLTTRIANESPIKIPCCGLEMHSSAKFYVFYGLGAAVVLVLCCVILTLAPKAGGDATADADTPAISTLHAFQTPKAVPNPPPDPMQSSSMP